MADKFLIMKDESHQFYFIQRAANGRVVFTSKKYKTEADAYKGLKKIVRELQERRKLKEEELRKVLRHLKEEEAIRKGGIWKLMAEEKRRERYQRRAPNQGTFLTIPKGKEQSKREEEEKVMNGLLQVIKKSKKIEELIKKLFEEFMKRDGVILDGQRENDQTIDPDEFLRNLRVSYKDDEMVEIQKPEKEKVSYSFNSMYFKSAQTKEWITFLDIIKRADLSYELGQAYNYHDEGSGIIKRFPIKTYGQRRQILREIDKKLKRFFKKDLGIDIPLHIHIYYNCKTGKPGLYMLKFKHDTAVVAVSADASKKEVMRIIHKFSLKSKTMRLTENELSTFAECIETARKRNYMEEDEILSLYDQALIINE